MLSLHQPPSRSEAGFSLVEVVLALAVIMIAIFATTQVLVSTTTAVVNQQQVNLARGILYSTTQSELIAESQASSTQFPIHGPGATTRTTKAGGFTFTVRQVWGWCAPSASSTPSTLGNYPTALYPTPVEPTYPVYVMAVTVSWKSSYPSSVNQVTEVPVPLADASTYVNYPSSSNNCPSGS